MGHMEATGKGNCKGPEIWDTWVSVHQSQRMLGPGGLGRDNEFDSKCDGKPFKGFWQKN